MTPLVLLEGIELSTSPLPKQCFLTQALILLAFWVPGLSVFAVCTGVSSDTVRGNF